MDSQTVATLLFACCCLFAIGSMAGSLDATVPGDPDDVVDVDAESLPLPADRVDELKDAVQADAQGSGGESVVDPAADGEQESPPLSYDPDDPPGEEPEPRDGDAAAAQSQSEPAQSTTPAPAESRWRQLLEYLLPALVLLATLGAAYYKRDWLRAKLAAVRGGEDDDPAEPAPLSVRSPGNEVERLWLEMVSRADPPEDPSLTPRERAEAVARAGLNRDAVEDLTRLYESVRYGDQPVTNDLVDEASTHYRRSTGESDD